MSAHEEWDITCFDPLPWSKFAWVVMNVCAGFVIIFGCYVIYLLWSRLKEKTMFYVKIICTLIILLFWSAGIQWCIHVTSSFYCIYEFQTWLDLGLSALFCYQIGISLLYFTFVIRLQFVFKGTALASSQFVFISFIIGLFIQILLSCMVMYYFYEFPPTEWLPAFNSMIAFGITNLFCSTALLIIFFRKILYLSDSTLLAAALRLVICASLGLFTSNLVSVFSFIRILVGDGEIPWMSHVMCLSIDISVNLFSIYLQFKFGSSLFQKLCSKSVNLCLSHTGNKNAIQLASSSSSNLKSSKTASATTNSTASATNSTTTNSTNITIENKDIASV